MIDVDQEIATFATEGHKRKLWLDRKGYYDA